MHEAQRRVADDPKDAAAMTLIGEIYIDGDAVPHSDVEAARWFRVAAGLGDREAAFALGVMLLNGATGVPADHDGAKALFEIRRARKGQAGALYDPGVMAPSAAAQRAWRDFAKAADYSPRRRRWRRRRRLLFLRRTSCATGKGVPLDIGESARIGSSALSDRFYVAAGQVEQRDCAVQRHRRRPRTKAAAAKLFLRAAARNNLIAQNRLAHLLCAGSRRADKDLVEAGNLEPFRQSGRSSTIPSTGTQATAGLTPEENKRVDDLIRRQSSF